MAQTRKTTKKAAPAARKTPARRAASKPKAAASAPKPTSMTGPLPPIVTLKHLAEWAGYNHGIPRKQAIAMFTGFVEDVSRVLKRGSRIRIPDLGILQVRTRPARPARMGRNPATGETIQIKAARVPRFSAGSKLKQVVNG
jgi:DNA-binding protein HU-beta